MDVSYLVAHTANNVVLEHEYRDENALNPDCVIVKIAYSAISAGTELAWISGNSNNPSVKPFPFYPGYSSVGEIVKVGSAVESFAVGDKVVVPWGGHRSYSFAQASRIHKIADPRIDLQQASLCHIASFPMLGVRRLQIQMGEAVMIAGLGLLGLVALQAARLSGWNFVLSVTFPSLEERSSASVNTHMQLSSPSPSFVSQTIPKEEVSPPV